MEITAKTIFDAIPGAGQESYHVARRATTGTKTHDRPMIRDLDEETADLIADALNTYHETGLSPRQLLDQRNALWDALENIKSYPIARTHPDGPSITRDHMAEIQAAIAKVMSEGRNREPESPRFPNVSCSQCGQTFGPGDHGFSHCENHEGMKGER